MAGYVLHEYVNALVQQSTEARWEPVNGAAFQELEPSQETKDYEKLSSLKGVRSRNGKRELATGSIRILRNPSSPSEGGTDVSADQSVEVGVKRHSSDAVECSPQPVETVTPSASAASAAELCSVPFIKIGSAMPEASVDFQGLRLSLIHI